MSHTVVVCGSLVPDPLQTLEPVMTGAVPSLKNEMMLPSVLDPWAAHALYEAANFAKNNAGTKVYLVSLGPKAKLQQLMMSLAQKVPFELVAVDGSASGFSDSDDVSTHLATAIGQIPGLDKSSMLLFGGCASASRDAGVTMQMVAEKLGIHEQFNSVDELKKNADGSFEILERVEGGKYQVSTITANTFLCAWATGKLPIPPNNPQVGMQNMKTIMPAIAKAATVKVDTAAIQYKKAELPKQKRETRVEKNMTADQIAAELAAWIKG